MQIIEFDQSRNIFEFEPSHFLFYNLVIKIDNLKIHDLEEIQTFIWKKSIVKQLSTISYKKDTINLLLEYTYNVTKGDFSIKTNQNIKNIPYKEKLISNIETLERQLKDNFEYLVFDIFIIDHDEDDYNNRFGYYNEDFDIFIIDHDEDDYNNRFGYYNEDFVL